MFLALLFLFLSLAAVFALCRFAGMSPIWALPVFVLAFALVHVLYLALFCLLSLPCDRSRPIEKQNPCSRAACIGASGFLCFYAGLRAELRGEEKLPRDRRFLYVSNHRSFFDPLLVMNRLRDYNISFVSKPSNMAIPLAGTIAYAAGFLTIDRENDRKALNTLLTAEDYIRRDLCSIGIYPEGTRSKGADMLPFHAGSFKIAQRAGVPLVIACVQDTEKASRRLFLRPTRVRLDILEVLPAERVKAMSTHDLAQYSRDRMLEDLGEAQPSAEQGR